MIAHFLYAHLWFGSHCRCWYFVFSQIASSIVLCTLMSAPVMYLTARMVLVQYTSDVNYTDIIEDTRKDTAAVAMAGLVSKPTVT